MFSNLAGWLARSPGKGNPSADMTPAPPLSGRPRGTVTFLFTDIEGSPRLWEDGRTAMSEALERHDTLLRKAIADSQGVIFSTGGDGLAAAFQRAADALRAMSTPKLDFRVRRGTLRSRFAWLYTQVTQKNEMVTISGRR
jgi:class 3 adenylate cyclase